MAGHAFNFFARLATRSAQYNLASDQVLAQEESGAEQQSGVRLLLHLGADVRILHRLHDILAGGTLRL